MNKDEKNIDRLFRDRLKGMRESPGKDAWAGIDYDLDRQNKGRFLWYLRVAAASILLLLSFAGGYYFALYNRAPEIVVNDNLPGVQPPEIKQPALSETDQQIPLPSEISIKGNKQETLTSSYDSFKPNNPAQQKTSGKRISPLKISMPFAALTVHQNDANKNFPKDIIIPGIVKRNNLQIEDEKVSENYDLEFITEQATDQLAAGKIPEGKLKLGATFSPLFSFREYHGNDQAMPESEANRFEKSLTAYSGGADLRYQLNNIIELNSGIYYSRIGMSSTGALIYKSNDNDLMLYSIITSAGNIGVKESNFPAEVLFIPAGKDSVSIEEIKNSKVTLNFNFLEIPLLARISILDRKLDINAGAGISGSVLLSKTASLEFNGESHQIGEPGEIRNYLYQSVLFVGVEYPFGKHFSFDLLPTMRYALNKINKQSDFDYRPYSFSIKTGIIYSF